MACAGLVQGMRDYFERRRIAQQCGSTNVPDLAALIGEPKQWDEVDRERIKAWMSGFIQADS